MTEPATDGVAPIETASVASIRRMLAGRCPRCGEGALFRGYLDVAPRCAACGLDYGFAASGDGPAAFVILIVGFVVVGAALVTEVKWSPPYWLHAVLWGSLTPILTLGLMRPAKALMIGLQYRHHAAEAGSHRHDRRGADT